MTRKLHAKSSRFLSLTHTLSLGLTRKGRQAKVSPSGFQYVFQRLLHAYEACAMPSHVTFLFREHGKQCTRAKLHAKCTRQGARLEPFLFSHNELHLDTGKMDPGPCSVRRRRRARNRRAAREDSVTLCLEVYGTRNHGRI